MIFRITFIVLSVFMSSSSAAQIRTAAYFSSDLKYQETIEDVGNPLPGNPIMIV